MHDKTRSFRCPDDLYEALGVYATANGISKTEAILAAIRQLVGLPTPGQNDTTAPGTLQSMMDRITALEEKWGSVDIQLGDIINQLTDHEEQLAPLRQDDQPDDLQQYPGQGAQPAATASSPAYTEATLGPADWGDDA
jgi:hypothetical protein